MKKFVCFVLTVTLLAGLVLIAHAESEYVLLGDLTPSEAVTIDDNVYWVDETGMTPGVNINIGGVEYEHGVSFHPRSEGPSYLVYNIEGQGYKTFYAVAGKDHSAGRDVGGDSGIKGTAVGTEVWVDGVLAAESGKLRYPDTYTYIVNIEGAKEVKIAVNDGGDNIYCDMTSWANAIFSKDAAEGFQVPAELVKGVITPAPTEEPTPEPTNPPDISERNVMYLSDMAWKDAMIYAGAHDGVPSRDENIADEELWIGEEYFEKGICMHANPGSNSYLEVDISGLGFKLFAAYLGTAVSEKYDVSMASVRFIFFVDGKEMKRTDVIRADNDPELVTIDVDGANLLRIEMDDGGDGISGDWGALGSAAFGRTNDVKDIYSTPTPKPTAEPTDAPTEKPAEPTAQAATDAPKNTDDAKATSGNSEKDSSGKFPTVPVVIGGVVLVGVVAAIVAVLAKKKKK